MSNLRVASDLYWCVRITWLQCKNLVHARPVRVTDTLPGSGPHMQSMLLVPRRIPMIFVVLVIAYGQYLLMQFYKARPLWPVCSLSPHLADLPRGCLPMLACPSAPLLCVHMGSGACPDAAAARREHAQTCAGVYKCRSMPPSAAKSSFQHAWTGAGVRECRSMPPAAAEGALSACRSM